MQLEKTEKDLDRALLNQLREQIKESEDRLASIREALRSKAEDGTYTQEQVSIFEKEIEEAEEGLDELRREQSTRREILELDCRIQQEETRLYSENSQQMKDEILTAIESGRVATDDIVELAQRYARVFGDSKL